MPILSDFYKHPPARLYDAKNPEVYILQLLCINLITKLFFITKVQLDMSLKLQQTQSGTFFFMVHCTCCGTAHFHRTLVHSTVSTVCFIQSINLL